MKKFVPFEKLSKKKQKELNKSKRNAWEINPVTRREKNPKAYDRNKLRSEKLLIAHCSLLIGKAVT